MRYKRAKNLSKEQEEYSSCKFAYKIDSYKNASESFLSLYTRMSVYAFNLNKKIELDLILLRLQISISSFTTFNEKKND